MERERYDEATEKIRALKSRLPEAAVKSLAEEVIRRAAALAPADAVKSVAADARPGVIMGLTEALVGSDPEAALHQIQNLQQAGADLEELELVYLAAAAQRLGTLWEDSILSVAEVTLGTSRIYGILRALDPIREVPRVPSGRSAMFANVPGDQHVLGIRMAADIFRRRGWDIDLLIGLSHNELVARVGETAHLIIGLSAGGGRVIAELARLVLAIRMQKPGVRIFVSGRAVTENADLVAAVQPDGMSADFERAYDMMMDLWRETTDAAAKP